MTDQARYGGAISRIARSGEYGFIDLPDGRDVFLHRSKLLNRSILQAGDQVVFSVIETDRGLRALDAELIGGPEIDAQAALGASAGIG
jgi:cold shock CspA family protein